MVSRVRAAVGACALLVVSLTAPPADAGPFTAMFTFGDSLVDTGNLFISTGGAQPLAPYFNGRFSDGPVWVETLAASLGLAGDAAPFLVGGKNYAFGGARTGTGSTPPGVLAQIGGLWAPSNPVADPNALFVISGGSNDMRDARLAFPTSSPADHAGRQTAAETAVANLSAAITLLASRGARHVLLPSLADLGATPEAVSLLGLATASTDATLRFNALLPILESTLEAGAPGLDIVIFDAYGLDASIRADALSNGGATFGIANIVLPCGTFPFSLGISCAVSLYADGLHPTAHAHEIAAGAALGALDDGSAVPAPATALLLLGALAGLTAGSRGRSGGRSRATA